MARIAAIFQVWLVATGATLGTSSGKAAKVISGRLRPTIFSLGSVYWKVITLKSIGAKPTRAGVIQFVAFRIKNGGLWGA